MFYFSRCTWWRYSPNRVLLHHETERKSNCFPWFFKCVATEEWLDMNTNEWPIILPWKAERAKRTALIARVPRPLANSCPSRSALQPVCDVTVKRTDGRGKEDGLHTLNYLAIHQLVLLLTFLQSGDWYFRLIYCKRSVVLQLPLKGMHPKPAVQDKSLQQGYVVEDLLPHFAGSGEWEEIPCLISESDNLGVQQTDPLPDGVYQHSEIMNFVCWLRVQLF